MPKCSVEEAYPLCVNAHRQGTNGENEQYFGKVSALQKFLITMPGLPYAAMTTLREGTLTLLYTNDYPHAAAGAIALMNSLEIMIDVPWDPFLANWSDNFRTKLCGFWMGRRRPFMIVGAFLIVCLSKFLMEPPMALSAEPPEGAGIGRHSYWRVVDCSLADCLPGAAMQETSSNISGPWALREVEFYETGYITNETKVAGTPLSSSSAQAIDGNLSTAASTSPRGNSWQDVPRRVRGPLGISCSGGAREVLNVRVLQHQMNQTSMKLGVQFSDDAITWSNPKKPGWEFEDEMQGKWVTSGWHYTSVKSAIWYGVFNALVNTIAHSMREVPMEGFLAEVSPDVGERTSLVMWRTAMLFVGGITGFISTSAIMTGAGGQDQCEKSPWSGCTALAPPILVFGIVYIVTLMIFSVCIKERSHESLGHPEETQSMTECFLAGFLNRPLKNLTLVGVVIAVGQGLAQAPVLQVYYMKYVLNDELIKEKYGIDRYLLPGIAGGVVFIGVALGMPLWTIVLRRIGRFSSAVWQLCLLTVVMVSGVLIGEGDLIPYLARVGAFGLILSGLLLTFPTLSMDIVDYDEFLTGQRREAMIQMIGPVCQKLAGLPTKVLPLMLMSHFGFNPRRQAQSPAVIWTLRLSMTAIPAVLMLPAIYIFWRGFPMRYEEQRQKLDEALELHRKGEASADPYYVGSVVRPVELLDDGARLGIGGLYVSSRKASILRHFFPSELQSVLATSEFESLKTKLRRRIAMASILVPVGLFLAVMSFSVVADSSKENPYAEILCTVGGMMFAVGALLLWFDGTRYSKACEAVREGITSDEVSAVIAIFRGFVDGDMQTAQSKPQDERASLQPSSSPGYGALEGQTA
jgi:Na+/melibiose symporter-like transporter